MTRLRSILCTGAAACLTALSLGAGNAPPGLNGGPESAGSSLPSPLSVGASASKLPAGVTHCDPSIPIRIELIPRTEPRAGANLTFEIVTESGIDPDLIQEMQVELEVPPRVRRIREPRDRGEISRRSRQSRQELEISVPDASRFAVRARLVVHLTNGRRISQTAVHWVDPGAEDSPEGMIGRIVNPDGTGIRVYQGSTLKK